MINIERAFRNERLLRALCGVNKQEFDILLVSFEKALITDDKERYQKNKQYRQRNIGGGKKGILRTPAHKLFFMLFYLKTYPTFDVAGFFFGDTDRSHPCRWVKKLLPILEKALGFSCVLPERQIRSVEEFMLHFPEINDLFIDGTEHNTQRPVSHKNQKRRYSGKKKRYTRKNTIMTDRHKRILLVSPTLNGRIHDKKQLDKNNWLKKIPPGATLWVDTGYMGIEKGLSPGVNVMRPRKKSKKHPLSSKEIEDNKVISSIRIVVENAIAGIKRLGAVNSTYRNHRGQDDKFILLAAGLWNFHLSMR